ncbi:MAG: hypothetical protein KA004_00770 [Verrucomicrobiales bacterium]|nr:hypothetical protein [Verrucomicrobiales bacterium]
MSDTLNLIITHQPAPCVARMLEWWHAIAPENSIWIAYGGTQENFSRIATERKLFLESERLRLPDPQRSRQSYQEIFQQVVRMDLLREWRHVHLAEYDQIPLQPELNRLQAVALHRQKADVLGYRLKRLDATNHPHFLAHWHDPKFRDFVRRISVRPEKNVILSMYGFGSFWTAEAFRAVAEVEEPLPVYLEIFMPTVAHHLGFRVRGIAEPPEFNTHAGNVARFLEKARADGIWNLHPVKDKWNVSTI